MNKILFVCLGNICRSPAAEGAFIYLLKQEGLFDKYYIDSAGTSSYHEGEKADSRMRQTADSRGIELPSWSRQVTDEDFDAFDLILAMDNKNYDDLEKICSKKENLKKIKMFTDFRQTMAHEEVPDPYYGGGKGFEEVMDLVIDCSNGLLAYLKV